jgi:nitroreductase
VTLHPSPPVIIVGCSDPKKSGVKDDQEYYLLEMGIALEHLMLAATELGLGTAWICAFNEKDVKKILKIPENIRVVAITPLGYPAEKKEKVKDRKKLEDITCNEYWK